MSTRWVVVLVWVGRVSVILLGVGVVATIGHTTTPLLPNGLSPIHPGKRIDSASCERCHAAITHEWKSSQHATAATDAIFESSWKNWPKAWCVNCHMPLIKDQLDAFGGEPEPAHLLGRWNL